MRCISTECCETTTKETTMTNQNKRKYYSAFRSSDVKPKPTLSQCLIKERKYHMERVRPSKQANCLKARENASNQVMIALGSV